MLADGRVQMLVYLPPTLVKKVKRLALDHDTSASHVVEQALHEWLARVADPPQRDSARAPRLASLPRKCLLFHLL